MGDDSAQILLPLLQAFAEGRDAPADLSLSHTSTSGHVSTFTRAQANGDVETASVTRDRPRLKGRVPVDAVRAAARAVLASGFPRIGPPPGAPVPPPTVPRVRLALRRGDTSVTAEVSAAHVDVVPPVFAAITAVARLGDSMRADVEATAAALRAFGNGTAQPGLAVEVCFAGGGDRSFTVSLAAESGAISETERRGGRQRTTSLGSALPHEKAEIARALLDAGFPSSHGKTKPVEGPHYVVSVRLRDTSVEVVLDAVSLEARSAGAVVRTLYAAASRFGARPLELRDEPPPARGIEDRAMDIGLLFANNRENVADVTLLYLDGSVSTGWYASRIQLGADVRLTLTHHPSAGVPARPDMVLEPSKLAGMRVSLSDGRDEIFGVAPPEVHAPRKGAGPASAPELLAFVNKQMSFDAVARWLAEHAGLWVLAERLERGGPMPKISVEGGLPTITVFTSEASLAAWLAKASDVQPGVMRDMSGADLFGQMPDLIGCIALDTGSPITVRIHGDFLKRLGMVCRAVTVERAASKLDDPANAKLVVGHLYGVALREQGAPGPDGVKNAVLMAVPGARGEMLAAAFSTFDCADAYFEANGGYGPGMMLRSMAGRDIIASLDFLQVQGIVMNPNGPGPRVVLDRQTCARLATVPR